MTLYCQVCLVQHEAVQAITVYDGEAVCVRHLADLVQMYMIGQDNGYPGLEEQLHSDIKTGLEGQHFDPHGNPIPTPA